MDRPCGPSLRQRPSARAPEPALRRARRRGGPACRRDGPGRLPRHRARLRLLRRDAVLLRASAGPRRRFRPRSWPSASWARPRPSWPSRSSPPSAALRHGEGPQVALLPGRPDRGRRDDRAVRAGLHRPVLVWPAAWGSVGCAGSRPPAGLPPAWRRSRSRGDLADLTQSRAETDGPEQADRR